MVELQIGDHRFNQGATQQILVLGLKVFLVIGIEHHLGPHIHEAGRFLVDLKHRLGLVNGHCLDEVEDAQDDNRKEGGDDQPATLEQDVPVVTQVKVLRHAGF